MIPPPMPPSNSSVTAAVTAPETHQGRRERMEADLQTAESYLVCCMYEEAASRSSSIIRHTHTTEATADVELEFELDEIRESAGMVFVQSFKELGRTPELFTELQKLFGSVPEIPVQVFLTAVCILISEGLSSNLRSIFEEFLSKWSYLEGEGYVLQKDQPQSYSGANTSLPITRAVMHAEKYFEVAEVYAITFLGMILRNRDFAVSWTEKAQLPEGKRQDMLRRLCSLSVAEHNPSGSVEVKERLQDPSASCSSISSNKEGFSQPIKSQCHPNGGQRKSTTSKFTFRAIDRISERISLCVGWFQTLRARHGNAQLVVTRRKTVFLSLLLFVAYSIYRKRTEALNENFVRQVSSVKRALRDAWQLAFSVNVNPLAAVQQLPSTPHGSR